MLSALISDMDDIAELFASLAAAQTQQVAQRLMERNIVDLVQKLRDQGLQLYPTKDGKEYVTPEQVEREILDAIAAHGGRMQVRSLDDELNIPQEIVDSTLDRLLASSRGKMRVMEGDIISSAYLDTICEEINSQLAEAGKNNSAILACTSPFTSFQFVRRASHRQTGKRTRPDSGRHGKCPGFALGYFRAWTSGTAGFVYYCVHSKANRHHHRGVDCHHAACVHSGYHSALPSAARAV